MYRTKDVESLKGKRQDCEKGRPVRITPDISMRMLKAQRAWTDLLYQLWFFFSPILYCSCSDSQSFSEFLRFSALLCLKDTHSFTSLLSNLSLWISPFPLLGCPVSLRVGKENDMNVSFRTKYITVTYRLHFDYCEFLYCFWLWKRSASMNAVSSTNLWVKWYNLDGILLTK